MYNQSSITGLCMLILATGITSCWYTEKIPLEPDAGGTDSDSDGDTDVDSDTDSDSDTDTGTDTDTEVIYDGQLAWAKRAGGSDDDNGNSISALADDAVLVTGYFVGTATFGSGELGETVLESIGYTDIFVAKYDADGTLAWAKPAGGSSGIDKGRSITALADGSALITGTFYETATFGLDETNQTVLDSNSGIDIFVAKHNADGTLAWAKSAGGSSTDYGRSISALTDGSALVTGDFTDNVTFGPGETNETILESDGPYVASDIFIAKYNVDGTLAWAKRAGGSSNDYSNSISTLPDGSVVITGWFRGEPTFGLGETGETVLSSDGGDDIFVAKYHADGTLAWAKRAGGIANDQGSSISALADGSSLVTGEFWITATFGLGETNEIVLTSNGSDDIFVAKYNADGTLAWAKNAGGPDWVSSHGISALSDGSALVTGEFWDTATFGLGEIGETVLNSDGYDDIFVARYNADGTLVWAKRAGGSDYDYSYGISALSDGSALVTGSFGCYGGTAIFGPGETNETVLESDGQEDIFVAKFGP